MEAHQRRALRVLRIVHGVLRIVHELHKQGYQLLRICPGMAPSGCYWRCTITPTSNILRSHGAMLFDWEGLVAHYSSGQDNEYFDWKDAIQDHVNQLAAKFCQRFPEIINSSEADDWNYAGWYVRMLGYAERGMFPVAYADWGEEPNPRFLPLLDCESDLPMPPPGDAEDRRET